MNNLAHPSISSILIGLGATLTFDIWSLLLHHALKIAPSNFCMVGRWILYMPKGIFRHSNIGAVAKKRGECSVGWIAHYMIGIAFSMVFVAFAGSIWLRQPTLIPALLFGMVTVLAPFLIMQPAFGLGFAASKTSNPSQARLRSLLNHIVFGLGLYCSGLLINWLM